MKFKNESEKEWWMEIYRAYINKQGYDPRYAKDVADNAVIALEERLPDA